MRTPFRLLLAFLVALLPLVGFGQVYLQKGQADTLYQTAKGGPVYYATPANLYHWRLALAKVRAGIADARLTFFGDSTSTGITGGSAGGTDSTVANDTSAAFKLVSLINSYLAPAARGLSIPASALNSQVDTRWTLGSGWAKFNSNWGYGSAIYKATTASSAGNLVFQDANSTADTWSVYYLANGGLAPITATAGSGTPVTVTPAAPQNVVHFDCVNTAGTPTTNTAVTINGTGSNSIYIVGIEPRQSTHKQVLIGNAGCGSSTTSNWTIGTPSGFAGPSAIAANAPDVSVISLGINDAGAALSPAQLKINLQLDITAAKLSGDVILVTPFPTGTGAGGTYTAYEQLYIPIYYQLAQQNGCVLVDLWQRYGNAYDANFQAGDFIHPLPVGYGDLAHLLYTVLSGPSAMMPGSDIYTMSHLRRGRFDGLLQRPSDLDLYRPSDYARGLTLR